MTHHRFSSEKAGSAAAVKANSSTAAKANSSAVDEVKAATKDTSNSSAAAVKSAPAQTLKAAAKIDAYDDPRRHRMISAAVIGPAGGQASMAHEFDLALTDKLAVGTLDFVATGAHTEYCKSWLHNNSFLCEFGTVFLGLLVCTPLVALSVAAFWGIVSGLKSIDR